MHCPACGSEENRVLESREVDDGLAIRRRRHCQACSTRFTTYERIEIIHLMVVKKNGNRESYEREKLARGIYRAFEKRPIPVDQIELLISRIEQHMQSIGEAELLSSQLGEMVMNEIMHIDPVAYVRFASVYRSFADIQSFERELTQLKKKQKE
ncbi:transcriptional repressor NrdR [Candidatus Saccharibacteria bacterium]|nr:transcriptional repressor NrdR [Candidatus Saccharibacteria bacterium]